MALLRRAASLAALFFVLVVVALQAVAHNFERSTIDPDFWWHVRVGDWILRLHAVPHVGIFSQHADRGWVAYSWGFEILMAWLFRLGGLAALPLTLAAFRALIVFAVFAMTLRLSDRPRAAWVLMTAAAFPLASVMVVRPILFTLLFYIIELGLIFEARRRASPAPLYWLAPLFLLWANMHIQFVYGLFVLTLFVGCELLRHAVPPFRQGFLSASPLKAAPTRLLLVYFVSLLATFVGPYWGAAYATILKYIAYVQQYNEISEFIALDFRSINDYFVVILVLAAGIAIGRKGLDLFTASLLFSTAMVGFRSRRDEWFPALAACALIAASIAREQPAASALQLRRAAQYAAMLLLAIAVAYGFAFTAYGLTPANLISAVDANFPVRATEYVRQNHLQGPVYNTFDWGGFLIFNLGDYPVSIDGRYDLYGPDLVERARRTLAADKWNLDPDLAQAGFVLLPKDQPLDSALAADPHYRLVYSDHIASIFVKSNPPGKNP